VEEILVYYNKSHTYNPQMIGDEIMKNTRSNHYDGENTYYGSQKPTKCNHKGRFPTDFLGKYSRIIQTKSPKSIHDDITKRMILTYSNEGDTILDMTCCDRNNGNISKELKRNYIGIDISDEFINC
jgi:DNA modification methylase